MKYCYLILPFKTKLLGLGFPLGLLQFVMLQGG